MNRPTLLALSLVAALAATGCTTKCGPGNCTGCCDSNNLCHAPEPANCGQGGGACVTCPGLQQCVLGACAFAPSGNGAGSGGTTAASSSASSASGSSGAASSGAASSGGTSSGSAASSAGSASSSGTSAASTSASSAASTASSSGSTSAGSTAGSTASGTTASATASTAASSSSGTSGTTTTTSSSSSGATTASSATASSSGSGTSGGTTSSSSSSASSSSSGGTSGGTTGSCSPSTLTLNVPVTGDTSAAADNYQLAQGAGCTAYDQSEGGDVLYAFTPPSSGAYQFTLHPTDAALDGVLYLLNSCPSASVSACVAGHDATAAGQDEVMNVSLTGGVRYLLVVDSYTATDVGPFSLTVATGQPPPANDQCAAPTALTPHLPGQTQSLSGDTTSASDEGRASCGGAGPDVFYSLTLNQAASVSVTATPTSGSSLTPVVSLFDVCGFPTSGGERACVAGADATSPVTVTSANLAPGTYVVVVDGLAGSAGGFTLDVSLAQPVPAPTNDLCSAPIALTPHLPGQTQSVSGDTTSANDEGRSTCGGSGPDVFYSLTLNQAASVSLTLSPTGSAGLDGVVSLARACGFGTADELSCGTAPSAGSAATAVMGTLAAGTYLVQVDGYSGSSGPFTLDVSLGTPVPPPANDACTAATPLAPHQPGETQHLTGDTTYATDEGNASCGSGGRDLFYTLTLNAPATVTATVTPSDGSLDPVLSLAGACGFPAAEQACEPSSSGAGSTATFTSAGPLAAGTYVLTVDSYVGASGPFALDISLAP